MSLDVLKSQALEQQYASLLSSAQFMDALKSVSKNDKTGKYSSLFKNLEKLNSSIEESNKDSNVTETEAGESLSLLKTIDPQPNSFNVNSSQQSSNVAADDAMRQIIEETIARADMMESMLDLEVSVDEESVNDLLGAFRRIISQLDQDTRKIHEEVKSKKTKEEFKLTPSNSTESGFNESITFLAK